MFIRMMFFYRIRYFRAYFFLLDMKGDPHSNRPLYLKIKMSFVISYPLGCVLYYLRSLVLNTFPFSFQACVDVRASSVFWQQMELAETIQGQPKLPEWLSTHPSHENRAEHLDRLIPEVSRVQRCVFFF